MNTKEYHCGVIDAFNEMVGCGVKKLALSHPFDTDEERKEILPFVEEICEKYHTMYYLEDRLLVCDLFAVSAQKGKYMILFYKDKKVLEEYLALKNVKAESIRRKEYVTVRQEIAYRFGELLSYPQSTIEKLIAENKEKG